MRKNRNTRTQIRGWKIRKREAIISSLGVSAGNKNVTCPETRETVQDWESENSETGKTKRQTFETPHVSQVEFYGADVSSFEFWFEAMVARLARSFSIGEAVLNLAHYKRSAITYA